MFSVLGVPNAGAEGQPGTCELPPPRRYREGVDDQLTLGASTSQRMAPLADRMRPRTLDEVVGQPQLTAADSPLRVSMASGTPHSMVLWGPPGTGKTTIALCVADAVEAEVEQLNAVTDGIKELRAVITRAEQRRAIGGRTLLFIDEIARWNKAQQDALLPYVENGTVVLVGSTTENPGFELNRALVSRVQVHVVLPLQDEDLAELARRALSDPERGVGIPTVTLVPPTSWRRTRSSTCCSSPTATRGGCWARSRARSSWRPTVA